MKKLVLVLIIILALIASGCGAHTVKVGFVGDLSSKSSQLCVDTRNAVELAVKNINESGGVRGRQIELIIEDSGPTTESAIQAHLEFRKKDVQFVIVHQTSAFADAVLESQGEDLLFVSPSMGTVALSGKDDFFIRSSSNNGVQADLFHEEMIFRGVQSAAVIYDLSNAAYTQKVYDRIEMLNSGGSYTLAGVPYNSRKDDLLDVAGKVHAYSPQVVLSISQAMDSAALVQYIKKENPDIVFYSVSWSMTGDFIENSGKAGEGTRFIGEYLSETPSERKQEFSAQFESEYGYAMPFIASLAYDAVLVLTKGMENAQGFNPSDVKQAILQHGPFEGLESQFSIDEFGDSDKKDMLYELEDGEYQAIQE